MDVWKILAILVLLAGLVMSIIGIRQVIRAKMPNACVVSFANSLGGMASLDLRESLQKDRHSGIIGTSLGVVFVCAGSVILLSLKK